MTGFYYEGRNVYCLVKNESLNTVQSTLILESINAISIPSHYHQHYHDNYACSFQD